MIAEISVTTEGHNAVVDADEACFSVHRSDLPQHVADPGWRSFLKLVVLVVFARVWGYSDAG